MLTIANMTLQVVGKSWQGTFLSSARQGIFFLPLMIVLSQTLGILGIQITQPIADFLTAAVSIPFMIIFFRGMSKEKI